MPGMLFQHLVLCRSERMYCMVDIYFVEQMGIHKIAVALFIRTSQSFIFIEIDSRYLRKIQVTVSYILPDVHKFQQEMNL